MKHTNPQLPVNLAINVQQAIEYEILSDKRIQDKRLPKFFRSWLYRKAVKRAVRKHCVYNVLYTPFKKIEKETLMKK